MQPTLERLILILSLFAALAVIPAVQADVYKWYDDSGKVQYTQTPPMDRPSVRIRTSANSTSTPAHEPAAPKASEKTTGPAQPGDQAADEGPIEVIDSDKLEAYCEKQRRSLDTLQNTKRISVRDGDTVRELSEAEKQARIARIRKNLETYCSKEE